MRRILAVCFVCLVTAAPPALAADPAAAPPVAACPDGAVPGRVFPMSIGGNPAGYHRECRMPTAPDSTSSSSTTAGAARRCVRASCRMRPGLPTVDHG